MNSTPQTLSLNRLKKLAQESLDLFALDPPDTDFQWGYKAAIEQMYSWVCVEEGLLND